MTAQPDYLHLDEAAALARTSIATVRFWIATQRLQSFKPGRRVLVRRADLIAFIESDGQVRSASATATRSAGGRR